MARCGEGFKKQKSANWEPHHDFAYLTLPSNRATDTFPSEEFWGFSLSLSSLTGHAHSRYTPNGSNLFFFAFLLLLLVLYFFFFLA